VQIERLMARDGSDADQAAAILAAQASRAQQCRFTRRARCCGRPPARRLQGHGRRLQGPRESPVAAMTPHRRRPAC
jgi:hypothetical protein